jgi:23S rRNA (uracil1939-C5)-methyltransferase
LQHLKPEDYRAFKTEGLHIALRKAGYNDATGEVHFLDAATRRRAEFKVMKAHKQVSLAYAMPRSHQLTPISECLILSSALQQRLAPLQKSMNNLSGVRPESVSLTEANNGAIDILMHYGTAAPLSVAQAETLMTEVGAARVSVEVNRRITVLCKSAEVEVTCGKFAIALPPDAFLQAAAEGQAFLTEKVLTAMAGKKQILDLFAGIGIYSFALAANASVTAAEGDKTMVMALNAAAKRHGVAQVLAEPRDLFTHPYTRNELKRYDAVVINPPRAGAAAQVAELAKSGISSVVMVSCNPATFSRDARVLKGAGFKLHSAHGLDQFVYSAHLEIVAHFTR